MSRIAKGPSDSLFKNKRARTIAKGGGFGLGLVCKLELGKPSTLVWGLMGVCAVRRIPSCETRLTLTPNTAAPSSDRSAKGYGRRSKKIEELHASFRTQIERLRQLEDETQPRG